MTGTLVILMAVAYLGFLFSIAYVIDRKPAGRTFKKWGVWIYAMALPVYCTAWTFYGSVGKAAVDGWSFLTILVRLPTWPRTPRQREGSFLPESRVVLY